MPRPIADLDARILRALGDAATAGANPWRSITGLAHMAGVSIPTASRALTRLLESGQVEHRRETRDEMRGRIVGETISGTLGGRLRPRIPAWRASLAMKPADFYRLAGSPSPSASSP